MSSGTDISALYREFTDALTEVLAENAVGPAPRGRLRKGSRCRQEASPIQRVWIFVGGRNRFRTLGSYAKRKSLAPAGAHAPTSFEY